MRHAKWPQSYEFHSDKCDEVSKGHRINLLCKGKAGLFFAKYDLVKKFTTLQFLTLS